MDKTDGCLVLIVVGLIFFLGFIIFKEEPDTMGSALDDVRSSWEQYCSDLDRYNKFLEKSGKSK